MLSQWWNKHVCCLMSLPCFRKYFCEVLLGSHFSVWWDGGRSVLQQEFSIFCTFWGIFNTKKSLLQEICLGQSIVRKYEFNSWVLIYTAITTNLCACTTIFSTNFIRVKFNLQNLSISECKFHALMPIPTFFSEAGLTWHWQYYVCEFRSPSNKLCIATVALSLHVLLVFFFVCVYVCVCARERELFL